MRRLQSVGYVLAVKAITEKLSTVLELSMSELKAAHSLARSLTHACMHAFHLTLVMAPRCTSLFFIPAE